MVRSLYLPYALLSCVGIFAPACGGSDVLDSPDARPDARVADVSVVDSTSSDTGSPAMDVSRPDTGVEATTRDAEAGLRDTGAPDADGGLRDVAVGQVDGPSDVAVDAPRVDGAVADAPRVDGQTIDATRDVALADVSPADADAAALDTGARDAEAGALDAEAGALDADARSEADVTAPQPLPNLLGSARTYAVLSGQTITITPGPPFTSITGDVGVYPGTAIATLPPGQPTGGVVHLGDPTALQAQSDLTVAYNNLAGRACGSNRSSVDLGGLTLPPNVYCFDSSAGLTGALVLDALGDPNAVWVFQVGTTLTTATNASVAVIGGGSPCNVYWQIGSSATIGTGTAMVGNIVALTSVSLVSSSTLLVGRALARNGAVTMDGNVVSAAACQ